MVAVTIGVLNGLYCFRTYTCDSTRLRTKARAVATKQKNENERVWVEQDYMRPELQETRLSPGGIQLRKGAFMHECHSFFLQEALSSRAGRAKQQLLCNYHESTLYLTEDTACW